MKKNSFYRMAVLFLLVVVGTACLSYPASIQPVQIATATFSMPTQSPTQTKKKPTAQLSRATELPSQASIPTVLSDFNVILGRPTADSITASLYSRSDIQVVVKYGTASGIYTSQTPPLSLKANVPQDVELTNLAPDTSYYYQITSNSRISSEHTFHTQQAPDDTFTFTINADPHYGDPNFNGELYTTTMTNALNDQPDFHIDLGDTFMTEKLKLQSLADGASAYVNMRSYFGILAANAPLFLVNGNHDGELGWLLSTRSKLPIWAMQLRQLYYPDPIPNSFYSGGSIPDPVLGSIRDAYYAWTWGDALFIALDPFWYSARKPDPNDLNSNWNYTLGKAQYDWLRSTLESSAAKFKFVFIHNLVGGNDKDSRGGIEATPYFEWGGKNADGSYGFDQHRPGWGKPIHQLLVENRVSAVFHGHDHVFVKQELDGIVYQEVPQPSTVCYNNTQIAQDYGYTYGDVLGSSGHLRVTVTPEQATVEYVRAFRPQDETTDQQNGQVDAKYIISP